jgi:ribosomal protein L11 methyltransferase
MSSSYIQLSFTNISTVQAEMLVASLSNFGFAGFEEEETGLHAFIESSLFDEQVARDIATHLGTDFSVTTIEETNWNQVWESNFEPVIVEDELTRQPWAVIRAHFHEPIAGAAQEIVITPKMSFGTGHHATTYMMMQQMKAIDFTGKTVFDFGTGTGVLAILADKLGAASILAIDNDEWSIENAQENTERNNCKKITLQKEDTANMGRQFDIILANINKNVIQDNMPVLAAQLKPGGTLLLSGLLPDDQEDILQNSQLYQLSLLHKVIRNNWLCMKLAY